MSTPDHFSNSAVLGEPTGPNGPRCCGGRVYLGKDSCLGPETFRAMCPDVERWLLTKAKYELAP